jgi:hypothetical protein
MGGVAIDEQREIRRIGSVADCGECQRAIGARGSPTQSKWQRGVSMMAILLNACEHAQVTTVDGDGFGDLALPLDAFFE